MQDFVKRMVDEHAELVVRTTKLHNYVYSDRSNNDDKVEFANKCIQLAAMKKYEECLRARLENVGIQYVEGNYVTIVTTVDAIINSEPVFEENADEDQNPKE